MRATNAGVETRLDNDPAEKPAQTPPADTRPDTTWLSGALPYLVLGTAAFVVALLAHHFIFPAYSWNRDEVTYLWQSDALGVGKFLTPDGGSPNAFWPWLAGYRDGSFFSQYTLGWPVVLLAMQTVFGSPALALPIGTVMAVLGTYVFTLELTREKTLAFVSGVLMLASPILILHSGIYLSYLFALGLGLFFCAALLGGLRRDSRLLLAVSGAFLGWVVLTRPFDAVLWAAPLAAYAVLVYWRRWKFLFRAAVWVAIGFLPFIVFTLAYNRKITGSFTEFPLTAKDPLDTLGFGTRRLMPADPTFEYTIGNAARSLAHNLRVLPPFMFGGFLAVAVGLAGVWVRRRSRSTLVLLALMVVFPAGYFFFWGSLLSSRYAGLTGPLYYIPLFAPFCVFVAAALIAIWRSRRGWAVAVIVALVIATAIPLVSKVSLNHTISEAQRPWKNATRSLHSPSLVIVENSGPYLMHLNPYSQNTTDLDGQVLFAVDQASANLDLIAAHPGRAVYLQRTSDPLWDDPVSYHDAPPPKITLIPLSVLTGTNFTLRVRVTNAGGGPVVIATLADGPTVDVQTAIETRTLATDSSRGETFDLDWTVDLSTVTGRAGYVSVAMASGASAEEALAGRQTQEYFAYRLVDRGLEVLYPSRKFVSKPIHHGPEKGKRALLSRPNPRALDVELTANR